MQKRTKNEPKAKPKRRKCCHNERERERESKTRRVLKSKILENNKNSQTKNTQNSQSLKTQTPQPPQTPYPTALSEPTKDIKRVYITKQNSLYKSVSFQDFRHDESLKVGEFDGAIATNNFQDIKGGIYDGKTLEMVATMDRAPQKQNHTLNSDFELEFIDESVIFGGMTWAHFGHFILEGLSRLWYLVKNPTDTRKIIYICDEAEIFKFKKQIIYDFFKMLGVDEYRLMFIEKPIKFAHISIPSVLFKADEIYYIKEYPLVYCACAKGANFIHNDKKCFDKIYISHTKWTHRTEMCFLNEDIYEKFFTQKGFKVLYPEEFSVSEMVYYVSNATQIATTMGTTAHYALFARRGTRFIVLTREANARHYSKDFTTLTTQCILHQAMKLDWFIIDANLNFLPSFDQGNGWGVVNYHFTEDFIDFANDYLDGFDPQFEYQKNPLDYVRAWVHMCANPDNYNIIIAALTPFDFLNKASEVLLGKSLNKEHFIKDIPLLPKKHKEKWYKRFWRHLKIMKF